MHPSITAVSIFLAILLACSMTVPASAAQPASELTTISERSGFRITGRYEEAAVLCRAFAQRFPSQARCFSFGTTPEGRTLWALAVSGDGTLTPAQARAAGRPVILAQGGIHAGEVDGKDAGFLVVRELLTSKSPTLSSATLLFVPVFNADGHERFGRWNRPNQNGPEEMGWRTTAQNFNLNRDYAKADAPEMQAMLRLLNAWDPAVYADLHATDGAQFEHDVAILSEPREGGDREVATLGDSIRDAVIARLAAKGSLPLAYYPSFNVTDDPASGIDAAPGMPRFSIAYWGLSNRVALLVETHSWKDYPTRVRITAEILRTLMDLAARDGAAWMATMRAADQRTSALAGKNYPLAFGVTEDVRIVDFRGYAYERTPSEISGALMTRYDTKRPQVWRMPLRDRAKVTFAAQAPGKGYVLPPAVATWLVPKLENHGIRHQPLGTVDGTLQVWRASAAKPAAQTFEGHTPFTLEGAWTEESVTAAPGSVFVPIAQPKARLVMALLEPQAPDSYAAWGFFATAFEKKEYMEPYVAEEVARQMLAKDAALRKQFEQRLASDAAFAGDADARLEFFYRRHASWDTNYNRYPVYRLE